MDHIRIVYAIYIIVLAAKYVKNLYSQLQLTAITSRTHIGNGE